MAYQTTLETSNDILSRGNGNSTYNDIINFVRRKLGHPVVRVELVEEHYVTAIEEALNMWTQLCGDESNRMVKEWYLDLTPGRVQYRIEDPDFDFIMEVATKTKNVLGVAGADGWLLYWNSAENRGFFRDIADFYIQYGFMDVAKRTIGADRTFEVITTPNGKKLHLYPSPTVNEMAYIRYAVKPTIDNVKEWNQWVKSYALASAKETLGRIRSKYGSGYPVAMNSGGGLVELDGARLLEESVREIEALKNEAQNWRGVIYPFFG